MLLLRFYAFGRHCWGEQVGDEIRVYEGTPFDGSLKPTDKRVSDEVVHALPPVTPTKIVCVGSNYRAHCEEMGKPVPEVPTLFLKPPSSLLAPGGSIEVPQDVGRVDFEGELAVVIGRRTRRVSEADVATHVLGYTALNDVTARLIQRSDVQFTRAKGFDTFCPVGPWVNTDLASGDDLALTTRVNGEVRQDSRTSDMVFGVARLVSFISHVMTLEPGDVIATGTPSGVGPIAPGDLVEIEIEHVGTLSNPVGAA